MDAIEFPAELQRQLSKSSDELVKGRGLLAKLEDEAEAVSRAVPGVKAISKESDLEKALGAMGGGEDVGIKRETRVAEQAELSLEEEADGTWTALRWVFFDLRLVHLSLPRSRSRSRSRSLFLSLSLPPPPPIEPQT